MAGGGAIERVDHVIVGAGQAGLVLARFLRDRNVVVLDPDPAAYKIGESIVPEQFQHPEMQALLPRVHALPSYRAKHGVTFVSGDSVASFPLPPKNQRESLHVARMELEALMQDAWGIEVRRERVRAIEVGGGRRLVHTDRATYDVAGPILDASGPAMVVSSLLGEVESLAPVHAAWTYLDVTARHDERFVAWHREAGHRFLYYDARRRRVVPSEHLEGFCPSHTTILTHVGEATWTWQIPLWGGDRLSFGVVSRKAAVTAEALLDLAANRHAPCYDVRPRPLDGSSPYNRLHVRSGFARRARTAATEDYVLVGDAFAFSDPVYSVGTALAVNKGIEVATWILEHGWDARAAEGYSRQMESLLQRSLAAFRFWYTGEVVTSDAAAAEVRDGFLLGTAFQVEAARHYRESLENATLSATPHRDDTQAIDWSRGSVLADVCERLELPVDPPEGRRVSGWDLHDAHHTRDGLWLAWKHPEKPEMAMIALPSDRAPVAFREAGSLRLYYMAPWGDEYPFDERVAALFDAVAPRVAAKEGDWLDLLAGAG